MTLASAGGAMAQADCRIDEAQQLLEATPRPYPQIDRLLADCAQARPGDWHVLWLQGISARGQGRLDQALPLLRAAHAAAPGETAPALDLAVLHEQRNERAAAAAVYAHVLQREPASRPALLGSARVARAQGDEARARAVYTRLLAADAQDADARLGLAWLDLDALRLEPARAGFEALAAAPSVQAEAREGLRQLDAAWRYRVDLGVGTAHLAAGNAQSASAALAINLNARDQVHLGFARNTRELASARLVDPTPLPSSIARLGYRTRTASDLTWALAYEHRGRRRDADEHRVEAAFDAPLRGGLNAFAGFRQGFGSAQWRNRVAHGGLSQQLSPEWRLAGTVFVGRNFLGTSERAYALNLHNETGPRGLFLDVGLAHSPDPGNTVVHGSVALPLSRTHALLLGVERRSLGRETEARVGWRMYLP